jgi:hypothetical protein
MSSGSRVPSAPVSIKSIIWYALQLDPSTFGIFDAFQA